MEAETYAAQLVTQLSLLQGMCLNLGEAQSSRAANYVDKVQLFPCVLVSSVLSQGV